jgi:hypothetical protein
MRDVMNFNKLFYKKCDREYQAHFILKHTEIMNCKRRRPGQSKNKENPKSHDPKLRTTRYYVRTANGEQKPVCLQSFLNILQISRFRINNITAKFHKDGFVSDKRGGFKRSAVFKPKRESVMKFINSLQCIESHYFRGQCQRKYLSSDLNVKKLWGLYSSKADNLPVKLSYFREILNTKYNLGFGTPRTDVCSTCLSLNERIKREVDVAKKNHLITEKRVHRLKYKAFYEKLQDPDEKKLILSYDCQKKSTPP